jgi:hypothetical protein
MRRKPTQWERVIAKRLSISDAQLFGLLSVKAGRGSVNVGHHLTAKGLATEDPNHPYHRLVLTPAGEALLKRARAMGY